jgi:hypothetical protein
MGLVNKNLNPDFCLPKRDLIDKLNNARNNMHVAYRAFTKIVRVVVRLSENESSHSFARQCKWTVEQYLRHYLPNP